MTTPEEFSEAIAEARRQLHQLIETLPPGEQKQAMRSLRKLLATIDDAVSPLLYAHLLISDYISLRHRQPGALL